MTFDQKQKTALFRYSVIAFVFARKGSSEIFVLGLL